MKILINVVNARNIGGGFQIVYNFILKTQEYVLGDVEWYYAVSERLDSFLDDNFKSNIPLGHYYIFPDQPDFKVTYWGVKRDLKSLEASIDPDVVFTPLAPGYFFFKHKEVMGFANAWITNATSYAWKSMSLKPKIRMWLYGIMQRFLLRKAKYIITQTETVKGGLLRVTNLSSDKVKVVPNVLPPVWQSVDPTPLKSDDHWIDVAAIGGPMPHKNLEIIPDVLDFLDREFDVHNVRFHTVLPTDSDVWNRIETGLKAHGREDCMVNHGNVKQEELSDLYRRCQLCFLPSVLETFSASAIEAMYFDLKTVATDLPFNKEVMKDSSLYYEPMNAKSAAEQIAKLVADETLRNQLSVKMKERLNDYYDFKKYFDSTVDFLQQVGRGTL